MIKNWLSTDVIKLRYIAWSQNGIFSTRHSCTITFDPYWGGSNPVVSKPACPLMDDTEFSTPLYLCPSFFIRLLRLVPNLVTVFTLWQINLQTTEYQSSEFWIIDFLGFLKVKLSCSHEWAPRSKLFCRCSRLLQCHMHYAPVWASTKNYVIGHSRLYSVWLPTKIDLIFWRVWWGGGQPKDDSIRGEGGGVSVTPHFWHAP